MSDLYPLKFEPQFIPKVWGRNKLQTILNKNPKGNNIGESWEISAVQNQISIVKNGFLKGNNLQELIEVYMGDLVGEHVFEQFGIEFPLLFKFIDAADDLSIQVHPNDAIAKERHNAYGKTEMWYIIQADKGARIISGFKKNTNKAEYLKALQNKELLQILNSEEAKEGDVFFIPSGRVHATGKGILLAEIQQTSDITYRIYDWDRPGPDGKMRDLHTDLALDVIDFKLYDNYKTKYNKQLNKVTELVDCNYFQTRLLHLNGRMEIDYSFVDSFVVYMCTQGKLTINYGGEKPETIEKGETILIPAVIEQLIITTEEESTILEVSIK